MVNQVVHVGLVEIEFEIGDGYEVSSTTRSMSWPSTAGSLYLSNLCLPTGVVQLASARNKYIT